MLARAHAFCACLIRVARSACGRVCLRVYVWVSEWMGVCGGGGGGWGGDTAVGGVVVVHSGDVRIGHKAARIKTMIPRLIEGLFDGDFSHRWTLWIVTLILS